MTEGSMLLVLIFIIIGVMIVVRLGWSDAYKDERVARKGAAKKSTASALLWVGLPIIAVIAAIVATSH
jgi:hypothetical protein